MPAPPGRRLMAEAPPLMVNRTVLQKVNENPAAREPLECGSRRADQPRFFESAAPTRVIHYWKKIATRDPGHTALTPVTRESHEVIRPRHIPRG